MLKLGMVYTEEQIKKIAKELAEEKNAKVIRRLQVISWRMNGKTDAEIMEWSGFCRKSIYNFLNKYKDGGVEALRSKCAGGNCRKLPLKEEKQIFDSLLEKAKAGSFLRGAELQKEFEAKAGVTYHQNNFYKVANRHGWRKQVPRGRHPKKADNEAIEASKKLTLRSAS